MPYPANGATLSHSVEEIDEKLARIPLATISESKWVRTDDWTFIADQDFDPDSGYAQSGIAIAGELESYVLKSEVITDEAIEALFSDDKAE
jgi:hypothetical protein